MKVLIFGGTVEGRELAERHLALGDSVTVCVTGEYAKALLPQGAAVLAKALPRDAMLQVMRDIAPDRVIDATHPFAQQAIRNIASCAGQLGLPLTRVRRRAADAGGWRSAVQWAQDAQQAARLLAGQAGNILLSTGSHTLPVYAALLPRERLYVRLLPTHEALEQAAACGIPPRQVLAMQGPFSADFNRALYAQWGISCLVTKESGEAGGLSDKVLPALSMGLTVVVIARPKEDA